MSQALAARPAVARIRDLIDLGKPRLSILVLFTAAIGLWMSPEVLPLVPSLIFLVATSALVAAANTLNCWIEAELDARMQRTRNRPLPAGRLDPPVALVSGLVLSIASLSVLWITTNPLTTGLGLVALLSYVLIYTPLKRFSPAALFVGAVPGALPPLMGFTAATNGLALPGWFVFGILFFWQLPHFAAISLYLKPDFAAAGFRVLSVALGDVRARRHLFAYTLAMVGFSLLAQPLGLAGWVYSAVALGLGLYKIRLAAAGLRPDADSAWARRFFLFTLIYLPALVTALVLRF